MYFHSRKVTQMTKIGNTIYAYIWYLKVLYYQKVVNVPVLVTILLPYPLHHPLFFLSKFSSAHQTVKYRLAIGWLFPQQPSANHRLGYSDEITFQFLALSVSMPELLIARKINSIDEVVKASIIGKKRSFTIQSEQIWTI